MEINNINSKIYYDTVRTTLFDSKEFSIAEENNDFFKFKLDFYVEKETPMNMMYIQMDVPINLDVVDSAEKPYVTPYNTFNHLNANFSKLSQPEYTFLKDIYSFRCYLGNNSYPIHQEIFNTYPCLRNINYQNRKKTKQEYLESLQFGISSSNNTYGLLDDQFSDIRTNPVGFQRTETKNTNLLDNFFTTMLYSNTPLPFAVSGFKTLSIPLSYFDPFFDNKACLPTNIKIKIEFEYRKENRKYAYMRAQPGFEYNNNGILAIKPYLIMAQYLLNKNVSNMLSRDKPIIINSKVFNVIPNKALGVRTENYQDFFNFENDTYDFRVTYNILKANALHFFVNNDYTQDFDNFNFNYILPNMKNFNLLPMNNYNDSIVASLVPRMMCYETQDFKQVIKNINNTFMKGADSGSVNLLNKDFYDCYDSPNYYYKKQHTTQIDSPTCYTFLLNSDFFSKDNTKHSELTDIKLFVEYKQPCFLPTAGNVITGPWNDPATKTEETIITLLEYTTQFIIDTSNNVKNFLV